MRFAYLLALFGEKGGFICREDNSRYITKVAEKIERENRGKAEWKSVENTKEAEIQVVRK